MGTNSAQTIVAATNGGNLVLERNTEDLCDVFDTLDVNDEVLDGGRPVSSYKGHGEVGKRGCCGRYGVSSFDTHL
jgi:hypothetical protein